MYVTHQLFKCLLFPNIWSVCVCVCRKLKFFSVQPNVEHRHGYMRETDTNITFGNTLRSPSDLTSVDKMILLF